MGRRSTNTVDYFPHYAKSGKTLAILEGRYQATGYSFWFKLLEMLCTSENHVIDCRNPETWEYLLARIPVDEQTGTEILDLLARLGNIDAELWSGRIIWCTALVGNLADAYKNRKRPAPEKPKLPVEIPSMTGISTVKNGVSTSRSTQSKVEQNKAEQSKEDHNGAAAFAATVPAIPSLHKKVEAGFLSHNGGKFTDYGKEGKAIQGLIAKAEARDKENAEDLLVSVCAAFWKLKQSRDKFWREQPFLPSTLNSSAIWDRVLETMRLDEIPEEVRKIIAGEII